MSADLEVREGRVSMAFTGDRANIWHRQGKQVPRDLTPAQMLEAANLNWRVEKEPLYRRRDGDVEAVDYFALTRDVDGKVLSIVTPGWEPTQNEEAFAFFNEFIAKGNMEMDTAGAIRDGRIVWANARMKNTFEVVPGDVVEAYLLFTNPHIFGYSIDCRFTPTRVVCSNTLSMALSGTSSKVYRQSHRSKFNETAALETLGLATEKMDQYEEAAKFLASKQAKDEDIVEFFKRIFPVQNNKKDHEVKKEISKNAQIAIDMVEEQPGAEFASGSWWSVFNSATFTIDHLIGKNDERRFDNAIFGGMASRKNAAMKLATEYAEAS